MFSKFKASFDEYVSKLPVAGQQAAQAAALAAGLPLAQPPNMPLPPSPRQGAFPAMPPPAPFAPQADAPKPLPPAPTPPQCYAAQYGDLGQTHGAGKSPYISGNPQEEMMQLARPSSKESALPPVPRQKLPKIEAIDVGPPAAEKQRYVQAPLASSPGVGSVYVGTYR
ncbi:hypothetical protein Y032_0899g2939 [Ancylostoma ceylanicum]|uniref:Uncharacterized protein n=1 Tax=Ancylostoma ceylanicum TaxID=53326 RepID=A0A016WAV2_9BILA|nr:hypothetical protein Y032_0899g2939 [Ancylostoma ceylanicum]